jgi:L-2-hydroxyglutarate oxidase LhgO
VEHLDVVVIGAGVVGLAVARALALAGREVMVLEAQAAIGQGVSSRNSEVIHAGLYYPPGSLKARLCVRGKALLYAYAAERAVGHAACGKLIVATEPAQLATLQGLATKAAANGVTVDWLSAAQAMALEPALRCVGALHSPSTGIVDSHGLMLALQGDLENAGGMVALGSRVLGIDFSAPNRPIVQVESAFHATKSGASTDSCQQSQWSANLVVNAASLHACALARRFSGLPAQHVPQEFLAKGNYYSLAGRAPFSRLIYPVPEPGGLGVHLTLDMGGQAKFGPDVEWLSVSDPEAIDYTVDPRRADAFYAQVRRYWPALPDGALQPSYSGVRPKIHSPQESAADFRIDGPAQHGLPGLVNLFGIESPGLTSAMAIAQHVLALVSAD